MEHQVKGHVVRSSRGWKLLLKVGSVALLLALAVDASVRMIAHGQWIAWSTVAILSAVAGALGSQLAWAWRHRSSAVPPRRAAELEPPPSEGQR